MRSWYICHLEKNNISTQVGVHLKATSIIAVSQQQQRKKILTYKAHITLLKPTNIMKTLQLLTVLLSFSTLTKAQSFSDFTLPSVTDTSHFTLSKAKSKFIALHFLLKTECPYCMRHTHEYFEKAATLPNVLQVFIKPDTEKEIKEWADKLSASDTLKYPIYQDANAMLATQYNIPTGYAFHGQIVHYPALILLNEEGKEVFRYIGKNNSDRYSFEKLTAKIQELNQTNK